MKRVAIELTGPGKTPFRGFVEVEEGLSIEEHRSAVLEKVYKLYAEMDEPWGYERIQYDGPNHMIRRDTWSFQLINGVGM